MKSALGFVQLIFFFALAVVGFSTFTEGCTDNYALNNNAIRDELLVVGVFDRQHSSGRFGQNRYTRRYLRGYVASSGTMQEISASDGCRHIDCTGIKENFDWLNKDRRAYRIPIWSANNGRTVAVRAPGETKPDTTKSNNDMTAGLVAMAVIGVPVLLVLLLKKPGEPVRWV